MRTERRGETHQPVSRTTDAEAPVAIANTLTLSFMLVARVWLLFLDDSELKVSCKEKQMRRVKTHM